jgi:hypothetical protein
MKVAVVPGALALLPQYAGLIDPIAELRLACQEAAAWLVEDGPTSVKVQGDARIAQTLLPGCAWGSDGEVWLVVASGSARRSEQAPGHLDKRAFDFDGAIGAALTSGDAAALRNIDEKLADELLATGIPGLKSLATLGRSRAKTWYDDDPYGVQYWVVTWSLES